MRCKIKSIIKFLLINMLLLSCNIKEKKQGEHNNQGVHNFNEADGIVIKIPENICKSTIRLDSLISEIKLVILETTDESLIGSINKVLSVDGSFIIHDKSNNAIIRFNTEGKFINKLGSVGNGPGQFNEAYDVAIDESKDEISVLDLKGRKVMKYKLNGELVGVSPMKFLFQQHEYLSDIMVTNVYRSFNKNTPEIGNHKLAFASSEQKVISVNQEYAANDRNSYTSSNPLRKFSERIYFNDPFYNRILRVKDQDVYTEFSFDFGKKGWEAKLDFDLLEDTDIVELIKDYWFFNGEFVVSGKCLHFKIMEDKHVGYLYYFIDTGKMVYGNSYSFGINENRMRSLMFRHPKWLSNDDKFISSIDPYEILRAKKYIIDGGVDVLSKDELKILNCSTEEDNPILMIFELNSPNGSSNELIK